MAFEGRIEDFSEISLSRDQLLARARELTWYHTLSLDESLRTEGIFDLAPYVGYYLPIQTLGGLDCFEVGSGNGFWAFEMEKLQARSVTTLDLPDFFETDFSIRPDKESERPAGRALPGAFGEPLRIAATLKRSNLRYVLGSVYDLTVDKHGSHDVVFCGSMLMHLFGPLLALQRMASICRDVLLITTQTEPSLEPQNVMAYLGHQIPYVHFVPSPTCLESMLGSCGFRHVLRGPTFNLEFRDRANPLRIPHTTFLAFKNRSESKLDVGSKVSTFGPGSLTVVSAPDRVAPGQAFDLTVQVKNLGTSTWMIDHDSDRLTVLAECEGGQDVRAVLGDFIVSQHTALAVLKCVAAPREGDMHIRLSVWNGRSRVASAAGEARISIRIPSLLSGLTEKLRGVVSRR